MDSEKIYEYTKMLTPLSDMAILLDVPESYLRDKIFDDTPEGKAYRKAKADVALEIRRRDIELAEAGSPSAAEKVHQHYITMLSDE